VTTEKKEGLPPRATSRSDRVHRVLWQVLFVNVAVVVIKLGAWWSSGALSIAAESMHSFLDALNNVFALAFAGVAAQEPDEEHPYGHQKFETLGALFLVGLLSVTVFELVKGAIVRIATPTPPPVEATPVALWGMGISVVAGLSISLWESRKGRELSSDLLLADAAHTRSDVLAALAVLAGLGAVKAGYPEVDPWITLAVAGLIAHTGWQIIQETVPVLVDERAVEARRIRRVALDTDGVRSCYGVRSRGRPGEIFAELTIAVDAGLSVARSHEIADRVEDAVASEVDAREVVVHVEPVEVRSGPGAP